MVATDTVVGIIGAVVLVAVMGGVFVYEYNNAPEASSDMESQEHFEEDFAGLSATQDMDGDGTANYLDDDIDGDGVANAQDTELTQIVAVTKNVPAPSATASGSATQGFTVQNGSIHFQGSLSYTRPNGAVAVPNVQASITGPGGFSANGVATTSGNTVTITFDVEEELVAGDYTLTLTNTGPAGPIPAGQAASVTGNLEIHYATPADGGMHDEH
jgi:hypothetical protein